MFNAIAIKISAGLFWVEIAKLILKFVQKYKGPRITKAILKKQKNRKKTPQTRGLTLPDFKTYNKATVVKTAW